MDETITTAPPTCSAIPGMARLQSHRLLFTFEFMILSKASSESPLMVPKYGLTAALQTKMSMRPHRSLVRETNASTSALREILQGMTVASPPSPRIALATSSHGSGLRLETTTLAPRRAIHSAIERPMPRLDPVITATLPSRRNGSFIGVSLFDR